MKQPIKGWYKIGEVSEILNLESHVLRYWESELPGIKPSRSKTGQRIYTRKDIKYLSEIKRLRYEEGFTISGIKKWLKEKNFKKRLAKGDQALPGEQEANLKEVLLKIREELKELVNLLENSDDRGVAQPG